MPRVRSVSLAVFAAALSALNAQQYVISTYAGGPPATDPAPATNVAIGSVTGMAADSAGSVYFSGLNCVFKLDARGALTRVAGGSHGGYSGDGGPAINAWMYTDNDESGTYSGVAVDPLGNLYVADTYNHRVRRISADGIISTVAGDGTPGFSGDGGPATEARLLLPAGIAVDTSGNLYIADLTASEVRKVSTDGTISTIAGNGTPGFSGDGALAVGALLNYPMGLALDAAGNLYIADSGNNRIRRIDANGVISTVAGDGTGASSGDSGPAAKAQLNRPSFVAVDSIGNLYSTTLDRVRRISPGGVITTVAGNGTNGYSGDGGPALNAPLSYSLGVAADANGNLYLADQSNARVRKVSQAGVITTVAGNGGASYGGDNGPAAGAQVDFGFGGPLGGGMAVDRAGTLYLADTGNHLVRKVSADGNITRVAGNGIAGYSGDGGPAINAQFALPSSVVLDAAGALYIADTWNFRIRKVSSDGIVTTVAGMGTQGHSGDGGDARNAQIGYPFGLAIGSDGSLYIADILSIRKVAPDGVISTLASFYAGALAGSGVQDGNVLAVAVDSAGNVYATDHAHNRVLRISPAGVITPYAGTGTSGFSGDGGPAVSAQLPVPVALTVDSADNVYVGEWGDYRVRRVSSAGIISTIAGTGIPGYSGDGGPATGAAIGQPFHLAAGPHGEIYLSDSQNTIRLLQPVGSSVSISSIVNGASFHSGPIAPGELVVIRGSGLASAALVSATPEMFGSYGSRLAGTTVLINGIAAPLVYASATAVAAIVPSSVSGETAPVTVTYQGGASVSFPIPVAPSAPGIFTGDSSGAGPAVALNQDGSANTTANPANAGDVISLFATGLGPFGSSPTVTIGGVITPAISVETQSAGVARVRVRIPAGINVGSGVVVSLQAGDVSSPEVTLSVRN
jgi:uncharacterized protein (TIGR03437 family)